MRCHPAAIGRDRTGSEPIAFPRRVQNLPSAVSYMFCYWIDVLRRFLYVLLLNNDDDDDDDCSRLISKCPVRFDSVYDPARFDAVWLLRDCHLIDAHCSVIDDYWL